MNPPLVIAVLVAGYLLGSIPSGYLAGRWLRGIDIRQEGSGSTGATNVLRVPGKGPALVVFLVDVLEGTAAVVLAKALIEPLGVPLGPAAWQPDSAVVAAGLAALAVHREHLGALDLHRRVLVHLQRAFAILTLLQDRRR